MWSIFGRMDIVVAANGKIIPSTRTQILASVEMATVTEIAVREGDRVEQGQLLLTLDARLHEFDQLKADGELDSMRLQMSRSVALLRSIETRQLQPLQNVEGIDLNRVRQAEGLLFSQWADWRQRRALLKAELERYHILKPLLKQRVNDYELLSKDGLVAQHALIKERQELLDVEAKIKDVSHRTSLTDAELIRSTHEALNEAARWIASTKVDGSRARVRGELMQIRAPVAGVIQQLAVHTIGGVVSPAQMLMAVVPNEAEMEVEAFIQNKDVGFVHAGQPAVVKVEAFPYTKYGLIEGSVTHVSHDAIDQSRLSDQEKKTMDMNAPLYSLKVLMSESSIQVGSEQKPLMPGMAVTVEVKTGKRRIIEYFMSPLLRYKSESLNER